MKLSKEDGEMLFKKYEHYKGKSGYDKKLKEYLVIIDLKINIEHDIIFEVKYEKSPNTHINLAYLNGNVTVSFNQDNL